MLNASWLTIHLTMRSALFSSAIWPAAVAAAALSSTGRGRALRFNEDGVFQISILEDLHYGEAPATFGPAQDRLTTKTIGCLLDQEPATDLVVLNGDIISRDNLMVNSTGYLDQAVQPLLERSLTWASLYGNHESNNIRNVRDILAREHTWPNARTRSMLSSGPDLDVGITNYYLPVFSSSCKSPSGCNCTPELIIWFFDSRSGFQHNKLDVNGKQVDRQSWVEPSVVDWFTAENERLTAKFGKTIPSLSFVHIPPNSFYAIQTTGPGIDPDRNPGINDNLESGQADGYCSDGVKNGTCVWGGQDIPFMKALASTPGLMGVFSAHKHGNSWCYKWTDETMPGYPVQPAAGLNLCYGQRTGYGGGGDWQRGARQLRLKLDEIANGELSTWIRLETGEVVGSVSLNKTFGQDVYPRSPNRKTFCEECELCLTTIHV
jgi:hypothetical protein